MNIWICDEIRENTLFSQNDLDNGDFASILTKTGNDKDLEVLVSADNGGDSEIFPVVFYPNLGLAALTIPPLSNYESTRRMETGHVLPNMLNAFVQSWVGQGWSVLVLRKYGVKLIELSKAHTGDGRDKR